MEAALAGLKAAPKKSAIADWSTRAAQPAEPVKLAGPRAADAPGGLVAYDPQTGEQVAAIIRSDPTPLRKGDPTKAMWQRVIAAINADGGAKAAG